MVQWIVQLETQYWLEFGVYCIEVSTCFGPPQGAKEGRCRRTKPIRLWRDIAEELSRELDSDKITQLTTELDRALQEQEGWNPPSEQGLGASVPTKE